MNDVNFYNGKLFEHHGTYNGVDYWIISYGYHPCAYVKYDQIESKTCCSEYGCHGEITFKGKRILWTGEEDVIGWDYAHLGLNDYSVHMTIFSDEKTKHLKRWTFSEVEKEVFDFIDKYRIKKEA